MHLFGHGRLSYVQIPAIDVRASARFYERVFGWKARGDGSNHLSFTDATGDISARGSPIARSHESRESCRTSTFMASTPSWNR